MGRSEVKIDKKCKILESQTPLELVLPHWYILEYHFIGQILRHVSGECIARSYVL